MSLKILGGSARGYFLESPKGDLIRPTQILLKRRIFDAYQDFEGFSFVDVCAGTGSMGVEAWSRGANNVFFSENHRKVFEILKMNIENVEQKYQVSKDFYLLNLEAEKALPIFLKQLREKNIENETVVFIDPPYEKHQVYFDLIKILKEFSFKGVIWIESDLVKGPSKEKLTSLLSVYREFSHGDAFVLMTEIL